MRKLDIATALLLFVGAINWGLVGIFDFNLIASFVENEWGDRVIYGLIGVAAIYRAVYFKSIRNRCEAEE